MRRVADGTDLTLLCEDMAWFRRELIDVATSFHSSNENKTNPGPSRTVSFDVSDGVEQAIETLTDPITGSPSRGKAVSGISCLHADDLFCVGDQEFYQCVISPIQK